MSRWMGWTLLMVVLGGTLMAAGCSTAHRPVPIAPKGAARTADSARAESAGVAQAAATDSVGWGKAALPRPDLGYNAREGRALYRHYCLNCHGEEGAGDGFNAYNLDPRPRALADSTFQANHSDDDLASAIGSGGGAVGLSTGMPPWGRTLNERKILNLVDYLRSLRASAEGSR